jgi:hypothetical protein
MISNDILISSQESQKEPMDLEWCLFKISCMVARTPNHANFPVSTDPPVALNITLACWYCHSIFSMCSMSSMERYTAQIVAWQAGNDYLQPQFCRQHAVRQLKQYQHPTYTSETRQSYLGNVSTLNINQLEILITHGRAIHHSTRSISRGAHLLLARGTWCCSRRAT